MFHLYHYSSYICIYTYIYIYTFVFAIKYLICITHSLRLFFFFSDGPHDHQKEYYLILYMNNICLFTVTLLLYKKNFIIYTAMFHILYLLTVIHLCCNILSLVKCLHFGYLQYPLYFLFHTLFLFTYTINFIVEKKEKGRQLQTGIKCANAVQ